MQTTEKKAKGGAYQVITNKGQEMSVKARSENGAWVKANAALGADEYVVSIAYKA